jgi:hypothetical protein
MPPFFRNRRRNRQAHESPMKSKTPGPNKELRRIPAIAANRIPTKGYLCLKNETAFTISAEG